MGITPSNSKRNLENVHRHQTLQRHLSHMGRCNFSQFSDCPPTLSSDGPESKCKSWQYRGIHLHCNLLYFYESPNAFTPNNTEAVAGSSCIPNPLTPNTSRSECNIIQESAKWRAVVVVDIQPPYYIRIRSADQFCEFDQWMNVLEGIHRLVPLNFLTPAQISEGGCLDEQQLQAAYLFLTNGSFSLPETRSKARQMSAMSGDEMIDRRTFETSKECSLTTSHFSVGEKVGILSILTDSKIDNRKEVWRDAKIIMIKKNNIRIHFLGWDKKWDTNIDVLKDGDRIKKCSSFLPILKSKTSMKCSGRATAFVSVSTIFESKKFYDALSMIQEGEDNASPESSIRSVTSLKSELEVQCDLPCLEGVSKFDDNASNFFNHYQSGKFEDNKAASYHNTNTVNCKNYTVNDNFDKTFNNKISRPVDIDNFEIEKNLLRNKIIENDKLIDYEKHDNCKTVFTKNGMISRINENPENSLMHSRLFSSTVSPNSSVEMFEYDKTKDFNLNRNADCPNFLPNIVKELKCFQSSNIDEENATS